MMNKNAPLLSPRSSVAELLARWPQVIPVFLRHHMSCVGCSMAAFETLEDAARIYGIRYDVFSNEIEKMIAEQLHKSGLQKTQE